MKFPPCRSSTYFQKLDIWSSHRRHKPNMWRPYCHSCPHHQTMQKLLPLASYPEVATSMVVMPYAFPMKMAYPLGGLPKWFSMPKCLAWQPHWSNCGPSRPCTNGMPTAKPHLPHAWSPWKTFCFQFHSPQMVKCPQCCCLTKFTASTQARNENDLLLAQSHMWLFIWTAKPFFGFTWPAKPLGSTS